MRKLLSCLGLLVFLAQSAGALQPEGWLYTDWPWVYEETSGDWHWFKADDELWAYGFPPANGWQKLDTCGLTDGWAYHAWPFAYSQNEDAWYFLNEQDAQWVINMRTMRWSRLGIRPTPPPDDSGGGADNPIDDGDDDWIDTIDGDGVYLIIDLSAGPNATRYPVTYLDSVPAGGWTDEHKTTKLVLRRVAAGSFMRGSPTDELGRNVLREPLVRVTLTNDYYIGIFQVTQRQWERVIGNWPSHFRNPDYRDARPVEQVSYNDIREDPRNRAISPTWPQSSQVHAESFMGRLRSRTGLLTLDLPTETMRERAGRAGTDTALNTGLNLTDEVVCPNVRAVGRYYHNHPGGHSGDPDVGLEGGTAAVGSYLPNDWGIYDMHGNVREHCLDWYSESYPPISPPVGITSGVARLVRGGAWDRSAAFCRSAYRVPVRSQEYRVNNVGFRVTRTLR